MTIEGLRELLKQFMRELPKLQPTLTAVAHRVAAHLCARLVRQLDMNHHQCRAAKHWSRNRLLPYHASSSAELDYNRLLVSNEGVGPFGVVVGSGGILYHPFRAVKPASGWHSKNYRYDEFVLKSPATRLHTGRGLVHRANAWGLG